MRAVNTPTRNPRPRFQKEAGFHYVSVEHDGKRFDHSPLDNMIDLESPTRSGEGMYEVAQELRDRTILKCTEADYAKMMAENTKYARASTIDPQASTRLRHGDDISSSEFTRFDESGTGVQTVLEG